MFQRYFWKFTFCMTFGVHKLVHSEPFLDYLYELWHLLSALCSDMRKNFYIVHIYILGPKVLLWIFSNPSAMYTKWCTQTIQQIFSIFTIFDRDFSKFVAPSSDEYENYVLPLKRRSLPKKRCKPHQNRPTNHQTIFVRTMSPSNKQWSGLGAWQIKKTRKQKHHLEGNAVPAG